LMVTFLAEIHLNINAEQLFISSICFVLVFREHSTYRC